MAHSTPVSRASPPDLLERLPPEVLLPTLKHLPDLSSLSNILRASPYAYRCFERGGSKIGVEIFEAILDSGTLHKHTASMVRIVTMLRSSTYPPDNLGHRTFQHMYEYETQILRDNRSYYRGSLPEVGTYRSLRLSPAISTSVLRGILASHRKNECLMISCLNFYLDRFRALRPLHIPDQEVDDTLSKCKRPYVWMGVDGEHISEFVGSWEVKPETYPVEVRDIGAPTWVEEQRVLRAFWRNQVVQQLRIKGRLYEDATELFWLRGHAARPKFHNGELVSDPAISDNIIIYDSAKFCLENDIVRSTLDYIVEKKDEISRTDFLHTRRDWPAPEPARTMDEEYELSYPTSKASDFWRYESGSDDFHDSYNEEASPLQHVPWVPYRRLGFAIWCNERLEGYGFFPVQSEETGFHIVSESSAFMAWKSVLSEEEVQELERVNKEWQDEQLQEWKPASFFA